MIEEQEDQTTEEAPETPEAEAPAEETPAPEAEAPEAAEEAPAEEAPAPAPAAAAEEPAEPEEQLGPKERRKRGRSTAGEAKPSRSLEEKLAERSAERATLAKHRRTRRAGEREKHRATAGERQPNPVAEREPGRQRTRQGIVVSDKADKTITVKIEVARPHRVYKKIVRTSSTLHAHDERNEAHIGDTVRIMESRPLSKTKRWRLVEIMERAR